MPEDYKILYQGNLKKSLIKCELLRVQFLGRHICKTFNVKFPEVYSSQVSATAW